MDLKLTTKRALEYEATTGKDIIEFLKEVAETNSIRIKDVLELFKACGEDYNEVVFDTWELPFAKKAEKVIMAVREYIEGKKA